MAEYKHGSMDTKVQKSTYEGFIKFGTWSVVFVIGILIFMAVFAT